MPERRRERDWLRFWLFWLRRLGGVTLPSEPTLRTCTDSNPGATLPPELVRGVGGGEPKTSDNVVARSIAFTFFTS